MSEDSKTMPLLRAENHVIAVVGGLVDESSATLCIYGHDLEPDDVSRLVGAEPTSAFRRGYKRTKSSPRMKHGAWFLRVEGPAPMGPDDHLKTLLGLITSSRSDWQKIRRRYDVRIGIGIHFNGWNRGFDLKPETVAGVSRLGIEVGYDIYAYPNDTVETLDKCFHRWLNKERWSAFRWTEEQKQAARKAFAASYQRKCRTIRAKVLEILESGKDPTRIWQVHEYLDGQRRETNFQYDYDYEILIAVFAGLLREGWVTETDLSGIGPDKVAKIKEVAASPVDPSTDRASS